MERGTFNIFFIVFCFIISDFFIKIFLFLFCIYSQKKTCFFKVEESEVERKHSEPNPIEKKKQRYQYSIIIEVFPQVGS